MSSRSVSVDDAVLYLRSEEPLCVTSLMKWGRSRCDQNGIDFECSCGRSSHSKSRLERPGRYDNDWKNLQPLMDLQYQALCDSRLNSFARLRSSLKRQDTFLISQSECKMKMLIFGR